MILPKKRVFTNKSATLHSEPFCPYYTNKGGHESLGRLRQDTSRMAPLRQSQYRPTPRLGR